MTILAARNLSFQYQSGEPIFSGLNFEALPGRILALGGANGSGKSTLISLLAGLMSPSGGQLRLGELEGKQAEKALRRQAALLPQNIDHWLLGETGREDLELGLDPAEEATAGRLAGLIGRWRLEDLLEMPVEAMSLGQKKRLALASALARDPVLLLLDEPMSGLDWPGVRTMLNDLAGLKAAGVITVLVTHEPALTRALVDDWLLLKKGGPALFGPDLREYFVEYGLRPF